MTEFVGSLFNLGVAPVLEHAMSFNETRHRLILSNIANGDTPEYRRQDLDHERFKEVLTAAIRERDEGHPDSFFLRDDARLPMSEGHRFLPGRWFRFPSNDGPLRHDGSNVSIEREMALLARNAGSYRTYAELLAKHFRQMGAAIAERV